VLEKQAARRYNEFMATYQIWADITPAGPNRFVVTVSAVPAHERTQQRTGGVTSGEATTLQEAEALRDTLVLTLGRKLRDRGHVILDVLHD
jgi:hypothetical protein